MKSQKDVLALASAFFQSNVLFALLKLRVFERIGEGSKTLSELARECEAQPETLARLLRAGVALNLLESEDGIDFRISAVSRPVLLPSAGENYLGHWILNLDYFQSAVCGLDHAVRQSAPTVDPAIHLGMDGERTREFVLAMHNYAALRGKELAHFLDTTTCNTLLDLGCGPGTYAFYVGLHNPALHLYLLDLPGILEVTREIQAGYSIQNRVDYLGLDVLNDDIPGSYDLILLSNILHTLGEHASRELIKRLYRSVNIGGSLVIQAQYLQDAPRPKPWPIFVDLVQLCTTSSGRNHTVDETQDWLQEAGFSRIEFCPMSMFNTSSYLRGYRL